MRTRCSEAQSRSWLEKNINMMSTNVDIYENWISTASKTKELPPSQPLSRQSVSNPTHLPTSLPITNLSSTQNEALPPPHRRRPHPSPHHHRLARLLLPTQRRPRPLHHRQRPRRHRLRLPQRRQLEQQDLLRAVVLRQLRDEPHHPLLHQHVSRARLYGYQLGPELVQEQVCRYE